MVNMNDLQAPPTGKDRIHKIISENADLFANKDSELGHTDAVGMQIDTQGHVPIKLRPYRTPINNRKIINEAIEEMLSANIVKKSRSPWSFPIVIADKKDGTKRFCVDFRELNQIVLIGDCRHRGNASLLLNEVVCVHKPFDPGK